MGNLAVYAAEGLAVTDDFLKKLQQLIEEYGVGILEDPDRLLQFLDDSYGSPDTVANFRFTLALHAIIKAGWTLKTDFSGVGRQIYFNKLVETLSFDGAEADAFLTALSKLMPENENKAALSNADGVVAHPGNLRKISGGIANHPRTMWLRKKIFYNGLVIFAAFLAIAVLFFQIGKQRNPVGSEFRIAFAAPISAQSVCGQTQLKAAQLAVEKINRQGGIRGFKLKIVGFNVPDDPNSASEKIEELLEDKSILLILTSLNGETAKKISEVSERMEIPLILTSSQMKNGIIENDEGKPNLYSFRLAGNSDEIARLMVYYAVYGLKGRRAALLWDECDSYSCETADAVRKWIKTYGRKIVADIGYKSGSVDYTLALKTIKANGADILMLPGNTKHAQEILAQASNVGFNGRILGTNFNQAASFDAEAATTDNSWWINPLALSDPQVMSVLNDYNKLYHEKCELSAAQEAIFVYDAVRWAAVALYKAPGYRGEAIRHGLLSTRNVALTHATLTTDPRTHGPLDKAYALVRCSHGKSIFQRRISVKTSF